GQREMDEKGLPEISEWAKKYSCGPQRKGMEIVDTKAGYVYDSSRLNQLRPGRGLLPAPGKAHVYSYPDCKDGRVVADVVRIDKGHTEGLEPKVTEELVRLMLSAKGSKAQQAPWSRVVYARTAFRRDARTAAGTSIATKRSAENR